MTAVHPLLAVEDVAATVGYYEATLGFTLEFAFPAAQPVFATVALEGARIMFEASSSFAAKHGPEAATEPRGRGVDLNVALTGDIEVYWGRVAAAGADMARPLFTTDYGMRQFTVRDPNGYLLTFIKHVE